MLNHGIERRRWSAFVSLALCAFVVSAKPLAASAGETALSDQRMATTPEALIKMLSETAYLKPEDYRAKWNAEAEATTHPLGLQPLAQRLDKATDPRRDIEAGDIQTSIDVLTDISLQSKRDGELLWGRIQGTKYERQASNWVEQQLKAYGFTDVRKDRVAARRPLWRLDELDFEVISAPGYQAGERYRFSNALTAYQSATTPQGGVIAELIYVGEGSPAELQGRNISGKFVLLRSKGLPGGLFHSARTAFSRIASGEYGQAAGVIMWSDVPNATQVATRVGSIGGGENIGLVLPWTAINNNDGYYLRKLLDRADKEHPVKVKLNVQGTEEGSDIRYSYNVYGVLPGQSGKYILNLAHVDGFLYGIHCNAGSVAMNLAMARHYAGIPEEERAHGLIFLFVGDHENPGVGATDRFIEHNRSLVENDILVILRAEKAGMIQEMGEGWLDGVHTNVARPSMLMITNRSPLLQNLFRQAIENYTIASADFVYTDPAADEVNFHPPYLDKGLITAGWATGTRYYHTTADGENDLVSAVEIEKMGRAYSYVIDQLGAYGKQDLEAGAVPYTADKSIYQSDLFKLLFGNH